MLCLAAPFLTLTSLGAPGDWPMFRGNSGQSGVASGALAEELELAWNFQAEGAIVSSPVVADGRVFFGCDDGKLHALDFESGEELWALATEDIIEAPPMVHGDTVYVGSSDFFMYAVDVESGQLKWKFETADKIAGGATWVAAPTGANKGEAGAGRLIFGSYDTRLYCLDAAKGEELWHYETGNYINGTPAVDAGVVVFGGCDAVLHVVSVATGKALARVELGPDSHVAGSVALAGGRAYLGHYGNAFVCVDMKEQTTVWSHRHKSQPFFSSPAVGEKWVVFGGRDKRLHCVQRSDGKEVWSFPTRRKVDGSPVIVGDKVVFGSGDGWVFVLSLKDGSKLWSYEIGRPIMSSPAVVDGRVLLGANDSRLYCFGPAPVSPEDEIK
ncbi:MAG: PQQ-binding-like beta-propeller repeat protein [Planctomycetota bacterium]|nr:PQQ-binding-like beta-propeller repeat protein [Planctomycetota bacterium]